MNILMICPMPAKRLEERSLQLLLLFAAAGGSNDLGQVEAFAAETIRKRSKRE